MPTTAVDHDQTVNPLTNYVAVRVNTLRSIDTVAADLFVQYEPQSAPMLYCRAGSRPDVQQFVELEEAGVENLYVRSAEFCNFSNGLLESLESILRNETIPATEKFAAMQLAVAVAMDHTLRLVDCGKFRDLAEQMGQEVVTLLSDGEVLPRELFQIARHDFNTFTHVTNVASYSVMLAERLGITDKKELRKIASAAILHDLGKRFIPASILAKPGRLTPEEREIIEAHPQRGYEELCDQSDLNFGQLMMVYQHHERVDGTGYPVRVPHREIHPWARMLAVVDVFDSMTAKRPYRRSATPESVMDYQKQLAGTHFDREVVECWVSAMNKT
ncbi:MAG: HD domain-containing protein [Planctomycetes bacterium]|nr:HD domain-containing protein [Planctomycetota bacterium]